MKKILMIMSVLILTLSMLTACGALNNFNGDENDGKQLAKYLIGISGLGTEEQREQAIEFVDLVDADLSIWPADKLPVDLPKYPNGEFLVITEEDAVGVSVQNTDTDTVKEYIDMLKADGWVIVDKSEYGFVIYEAAKDGWELIIQQSISTHVIILIEKAG